jgi:phosphatidate phosphatase APP1
MKRAKLVNFLSIITNNHLSIRASLTMKANNYPKRSKVSFEPRFPIQAYKLLKTYSFKIRIICKDKDQEVIYIREFESDSFGCFNIKLAIKERLQDIAVIEVYEIGKHEGLELLIGNFIPLRISGEKKLVICDFDKTLVDTKYSTPEEIYHSLTSPIEKFPTVEKSVEMIKQFIEDGYHPFILSASPHFYEDAMRDWLYANKIYTAGIFLKDYRKVFSLFENDLTPKDIKVQGLYKLNHLLDILYMTGVPNELILMGDNYESDPLIYITLYQILVEKVEPREIWTKLKQFEAFKLGSKQNSLLLNKMYQLSDIMKRTPHTANIKIFIRRKGTETKVTIPSEFEQLSHQVELYSS